MSRIVSSRWLGRLMAGLVALPEFLGVCEWGHDVAARRAADRQRFVAAQSDGPGLTGMCEVVVNARDVGAARRRWQRLLDPAAPSDDRWHLGGGPALSVESGARDCLERLVFGAASLPRARAWLAARELLDPDSTDAELRLAPRC